MKINALFYVTISIILFLLGYRRKVFIQQQPNLLLILLSVVLFTISILSFQESFK